MMESPKDTNSKTQSISKDTTDIVSPSKTCEASSDFGMRERSGSVGQLFSLEKIHPPRPLLHSHKGSLGHLFNNMLDKEHNYFGNVFSDSIDDLDSFSQISDSGFSDISQNTQSSVNSVVNTGMRKNASASNLLDKASEVNTPLQRKVSCADDSLASKGASLKEKASQKRLSHSMIWNWVKSQQVKIDEDSSLDTSQSGINVDHKKDVGGQHNKNSRCKISLRDINAVSPSNW